MAGVVVAGGGATSGVTLAVAGGDPTVAVVLGAVVSTVVVGVVVEVVVVDVVVVVVEPPLSAPARRLGGCVARYRHGLDDRHR